MKKILLTLLLGYVVSACTDKEVIETKSLTQSGTIRFKIELPNTGSSTRSALNSPEDIVDYDSDFQIKQINAYVFDSMGQLQKVYTDVENNLSKESPTSDITLVDVPAGNNRTLLCVVNPDSFEELNNLPEYVTLEQIFQYKSNQVNADKPDATMFMVSKNVINVQEGTTNNITGVLSRGVARLDIFSIDTQIAVDSVRVLDVASRSYMMPREESTKEKISLTKKLQTFDGRAKIAYLNEIEEPINLEIYITRDGIQGVANLRIPYVKRNNIYSVNLEVTNGSHLVTGTLSITPWTNNVMEGNITSNVLLDTEKTINSFIMNDGGSVSMANDTTLLLPGGSGNGLLYFKDGAEVAVALINAKDTAMVDINRNAATRGSITTSFDIHIKPLETTAPDSLRETKLNVTNLMTGKDHIFVIRQQSAGYKRFRIPQLNFSNSHQYTKSIELESILSVNELVMPTDKYFNISATKQSSGTYHITVNKKRIYDIVPTGKQLVITRAGRKAIVIDLTADRGFVYEEVQMGNITFMDRDLGASNVGHLGEIFIPGSLIPVDQTGFSPGVSNGFVGQGRATAANVSHNYTTKWFTINGTKNEEIDPCPDGWHVAKFSEYEEIFTSVVGVRDNPIINQGRLNTSVGFDSSNKTINVSLAGKTLTFNYSGGYYMEKKGFTRDTGEWPCAWWSSDKISDIRFKHLSMDVLSPYEIGLREHTGLSGNNKKLGFNIRCVKDNSSSSSSARIPTVQLGGKEWMAFNSMGKGNNVQLLCNEWDDVESLYKEQWTEHLGMLFQWGRKYAHNQWTTYANNPGKETNTYNDWNAKPAQVPCPDGFRVPTEVELTQLLPTNSELPKQATYLYGNERVRASLHSATPATVSGWHNYSGEARYLKITSMETGNYIIFPLSGTKADKSSSSNPQLGKSFRLWHSGLSAQSNWSGRITDLKYVPELRTTAVPTLDTTRPKEAYDYVRCIKK